jgi:hypothetical protein
MGKWAKRVGLGFGLAVLAAGGYAALNWTSLSARYAGHRFRSATTDEDRTRAAARLLGYGDAGMPYLVDAFRSDDPAVCSATETAVRDHLASVPPADARFAGCCRPLLDGFDTYSDPGKAAVLGLVPEFLKCPEPDAVGKCRAAVRAGLGCKSAEGKVRAVRLALRPEVGLKPDVAPLLSDPAAEVRRAAMLAIGPAADGSHPAVGDEALFRWLHDPDPEVRELCAAALKTRGLDAAQVHLARQLTHPDPAERLKLLVDLRWAGEAVKDPGPWLERLSRDPDPAVRLGAARVGFESRLVFAGWLDRLADQDPDPTVRKWAGYYRGLAAAVKPTGFRP